MSVARRALLVTPRCGDGDGVSVASLLVARSLRAAGIPLEVWGLGAIEGLDLGVRSRSSRGSRTLLGAWTAAATIGSWRGALVVATHVHLAPLAAPLVLRGARLAVFLHGIEVWTPLDAARRAAARMATTLLVNSDYTRSRARVANPELPWDRARLCPLAVPAALPSSVARRPVAPYALLVGRMDRRERYKGHDVLLDVWPRVRRAAPAARLVIAGDGDDRARLEAAAARNGLAGTVEFVGRVERQQLDQLYRDCALFVMPSAGEGFGLVFVEAMRAGRACIGGLGAAEEVIEDGVTGLIVDPARPDELSAALVRLFRQEELCDAMGRAGQARFQERFTEAAFAARLLEALADRGQPCAV